MKSQQPIVFYISGHGLGHASRDIELIPALRRQFPDAPIVVRTSAQRWVFELNAPEHVEVIPVEVDTGIVQIDSLTLDEEATARRAAAFYATFERRVDDEAAFLRSAAPLVALGDIPPLAFAAAARAGVPSVAIGNFTWDWIYAAYDAFSRDAPHVVPAIEAAYAQTTRALRLPLHGGFAPMRAVVTDIPFIARRSGRDPRGTRRSLGIPDDRPIVLASFGGYGVELPYERVARGGDLTVVTPDRLRGHVPADEHLVRIDERALYDRGFRYEDLVACADVVLTKPGYGIVSECLANDTAVLYTSRGRFIEYDVFVEQMPRFIRCRYLPREDLLAGRWTDGVRMLLAQPPPSERARVDGAAVAAGLVADLVVG